MTPQELLAELRRLDVRLTVENGRLKVNAPKGALSAELQHQMTAHKAALLEYVTAATLSSGAPPKLSRVSREGPLPLSFTQERLWFLQQLNPTSTAYYIVNAFRLLGPLDVAALDRSWAAVCARHEMLRTRIVTDDGQPFVLVDPMPPAGMFARVDFPDMTTVDQERACDGLIEEEATRAFNLERGPLATMKVVRLSDREHLVILRMHHIVSDQWSMQVLARDVAAFYNHHVGAAQLELPELPVQYVDYASWQRAWLQGDVWERELAHWRARLEGVPTLQLLTDSTRPAVAGSVGARVSAQLPTELLSESETLALQTQTTSFMVLLAAFAALLHKHTNQTDLPVATPVANRRRSDVEQVVGAFINTLVLRIRTEDDPTFTELLDRVRAVTLEAFEHQHAPFERLVAALHPARDPSRAPLAQVMFNLVNDSAAPSVRFSGISGETVEVKRQSAMLDLSFIVRLGPNPRVVAEYRSDLFDDRTIKRMLAQYTHLLAQWMRAPETRLSDVDLLTDDDKTQLAEWNGTAVTYDEDEGVESMVAAQARLTPNRAAVRCGERTLTYADLDARSSTLAAYLHHLGIGRESLVGVCLERSPDLVVALLGILKAGAAYVPLDPAFPASRLAIMVEDSTLTLVMTDEESEAVLPDADVSRLRIDRDWDRIAAAPPASASGASGESLAYVLYTSGSTGRPKGVQVPRKALTNFIRSMQCRPGIEPGSVLLAVTTLSFDIAGLELYLPLTVGGTVVLATRDQAADGHELSALMQASGATMMQATPATWRLLFDSGWTGSSTLTALCGGEPLPRELALQLLGRTRTLWNMYGPTETTIWSTVEEVVPGERITVGRPIANTQIHVVDERLRVVPIGVPGEVCIGGDGVARGYLGRPELTAERFVADPFSRAPHARLYRTGDLGRWLADGRLELLGRADQQVKVRGFRIELGEVEAVLERHPDVQQAVASVFDDSAGYGRLIAYLVNRAGAEPTATELRRFARQELPDYMVPSLFMALESLPLTPNGKVDRRALPRPSLSNRSDAGRVPPRTAMEHTVANVWKDVLGIPEVSVHDNFFDVGGHSLLSMQVVARLEKQLGVRLNPGRFLMDTLEQISAACEQLVAKSRA